MQIAVFCFSARGVYSQKKRENLKDKTLYYKIQFHFFIIIPRRVISTHKDTEEYSQTHQLHALVYLTYKFQWHIFLDPVLQQAFLLKVALNCL